MFDEYAIKAVASYVQQSGHKVDLSEDYERSQYILTVLDEYDKDGHLLQILSTDWDNEFISRVSTSLIKFPGEYAFKLYDTYGFPLDLTELIAEERGLKVDIAEFTELMETQRNLSRVNRLFQQGSVNPSGDQVEGFTSQIDENDFHFVGYDELETDGSVLYSDGDRLILDCTPFYGESGGQVGDQGVLEEIDGERLVLRVRDTLKGGKVNVHILETPKTVHRTRRFRAKVDRDRRVQTMRNHTATHIVHEALRRVLGTHLHQQGSLVAPDRLRFDFNHFQKVSPDEIREIEDIVNEKIADGHNC